MVTGAPDTLFNSLIIVSTTAAFELVRAPATAGPKLENNGNDGNTPEPTWDGVTLMVGDTE